MRRDVIVFAVLALIMAACVLALSRAFGPRITAEATLVVLVVTSLLTLLIARAL